MTDKWTDERLSDVLDVDYHHLVFTVPWQLRSITLANPKVMLGLMFRSVSISLQSWTKKYGGYTPGIYCIVHTFGSDFGKAIPLGKIPSPLPCIDYSRRVKLR